MKILVADDSRSTRAMMRAVVARTGHEVEEAEEGKSALDILRRPSTPLIAILDWQMPGMDGIDICRVIRDEVKSGLPYIIMVTARADKDSLVAAFDAGADDFIVKPYNAQELLARVRAGARIVDLNQRNNAYMLKLQHQQRLEAVGRLAEGIAHEINTPCQYIGDNLRFLQDAFVAFSRIIDMCSVLERDAPPRLDDFIKDIKTLKADTDFSYLLEEIPSAVQQGIEGIDAVSKIVNALRNIAVSGSEKKVELDVHDALLNTMEVSKREWKSTAVVETDFQADLPKIKCIPGDIHQVFVNLLIRAANAVAKRKLSDAKDEDASGVIKISTARKDSFVEICFEDTGVLISSTAREVLFDPFYAFKEKNRDEGQGLAVAYDIIVNRHGGTLTLSSKENEGTVFSARLPIDG